MDEGRNRPVTNRPVVLLVEDDLSMLEGIRDVLELDGYEVMVANNGQEALEQMAERRPSVIVSDVMMPDVDGLKLCEMVRQKDDWAAIPFIFLTAKGQRLDMRAGMQVGADDYLVKPFDPEELLAAVEARLGRLEKVTAKSAEQLARLRTNIVRLVGHELRTPLTFVKGYTELLEESVGDLSPSEMVQFLRSIKMGSDRLDRLVQDLVFLLGLETGDARAAYEHEKSWLDLAEVARDVVRSLRDLAAAHDTVILERLAGKTLPIIGHRGFLVDALTRVMENAIKFAKPEGGQVIAAGQVSADRVRLWVVDNGVGIPDEQLGRIFDPFYQVDRDKMEQQGAGIGLAIARGILELHGGEISVDSRQGVGSTFTLTLPSSVNMHDPDRVFSSRISLPVDSR